MILSYYWNQTSSGFISSLLVHVHLNTAAVKCIVLWLSPTPLSPHAISALLLKIKRCEAQWPAISAVNVPFALKWIETLWPHSMKIMANEAEKRKTSAQIDLPAVTYLHLTSLQPLWKGSADHSTQPDSCWTLIPFSSQTFHLHQLHKVELIETYEGTPWEARVPKRITFYYAANSCKKNKIKYQNKTKTDDCSWDSGWREIDICWTNKELQARIF